MILLGVNGLEHIYEGEENSVGLSTESSCTLKVEISQVLTDCNLSIENKQKQHGKIHALKSKRKIPALKSKQPFIQYII